MAAVVALPTGAGAVRSTTTSWLKLPAVRGMGLKSARARLAPREAALKASRNDFMGREGCFMGSWAQGSGKQRQAAQGTFHCRSRGGFHTNLRGNCRQGDAQKLCAARSRTVL